MNTDRQALESNNLKTYPHHAEQALIAGLLIAPSRWDEISSRISADDFCLRQHQHIFAAIENVTARHRPCDFVNVAEMMRDCETLETSGGERYLRDLIDSYETAVNIEAYADIVREGAVLRAIASICGEIVDSVEHPQGRSAMQLLDIAEAKIFAIKNKFQNNEQLGLRHIKPALADVVEYLGKISANGGNEVTGVSTGFRELDRMTTGMHGGDLIIVAGRPGMGKTTLAMNIAQSVALDSQLPVAVFSLEMPTRQLALRMLSSVAQIDQSRLRIGQFNEDERGRYITNINKLKCAPLYIDDSATISISDFRSRARRLKSDMNGKLGLIVVDYLQLIQLPDSKNTNRATLIGDLSRDLKLLAKEMDVPVIALSQLSRAVESRPNRRPIMSDLRESGAIEQDADMILFVYRDEFYNEESKDKGMAEIIIGKQRNGPIGTVRLRYEGQYLLFSDLQVGDFGQSVTYGFDE